MYYVDYFLSLRCAGDFINAVGKVRNFSKEISEAMGILMELKKIVPREPKFKYTVIDFCAGNCFTGILSVFTLPVKECIAYDKRNVFKESMRSIKRWKFIQKDIYEPIEIPENSIIVSSHPCRNLAKRIIEIYNTNKNARALVLIPCCVGEMEPIFDPLSFLEEETGKYELWVFYLYHLCAGNRKAKRDKYILSPANIVITAVKG